MTAAQLMKLLKETNCGGFFSLQVRVMVYKNADGIETADPYYQLITDNVPEAIQAHSWADLWGEYQRLTSPLPESTKQIVAGEALEGLSVAAEVKS